MDSRSRITSTVPTLRPVSRNSGSDGISLCHAGFGTILYIPLGGNRQGRWRTYFNLSIVFALCGLWHGAATNFIVWGLFHGFFLVLERAVPRLQNLPRVLGHSYTLFVVLIGWVLFRCDSGHHLESFLMAMFGMSTKVYFVATEVVSPAWSVLFLAAAILSVVQLNRDCIPLQRIWFAPVPYGLLFGSCVVLLVCGTHNPFIYFRF